MPPTPPPPPEIHVSYPDPSGAPGNEYFVRGGGRFFVWGVVENGDILLHDVDLQIFQQASGAPLPWTVFKQMTLGFPASWGFYVIGDPNFAGAFKVTARLLDNAGGQMDVASVQHLKLGPQFDKPAGP